MDEALETPPFPLISVSRRPPGRSAGQAGGERCLSALKFLQESTGTHCEARLRSILRPSSVVARGHPRFIYVAVGWCPAASPGNILNIRSREAARLMLIKMRVNVHMMNVEVLLALCATSCQMDGSVGYPSRPFVLRKLFGACQATPFLLQINGFGQWAKEELKIAHDSGTPSMILPAMFTSRNDTPCLWFQLKGRPAPQPPQPWSCGDSVTHYSSDSDTRSGSPKGKSIGLLGGAVGPKLPSCV